MRHLRERPAVWTEYPAPALRVLGSPGPKDKAQMASESTDGSRTSEQHYEDPESMHKMPESRQSDKGRLADFGITKTLNTNGANGQMHERTSRHLPVRDIRVRSSNLYAGRPIIL